MDASQSRLAEASRQLQCALEYRRVARERYTTADELHECDEAVEHAHSVTFAAWVTRHD